MPSGPRPMHPSVRQRQNVPATASVLEVLPARERSRIEVPELPADRLWDPKTSDFWHDVWQSPMRLEWDAADHHKLLLMAYALDEFYGVAGDVEMKRLDRAYALNKLAKTVMDLGARMGVDPFARRSLQWLLVQTEKAEAERDESKERTAASRDRRAEPRKRGLSGLQ